jgi:hypothetical protein
MAARSMSRLNEGLRPILGAPKMRKWAWWEDLPRLGGLANRYELHFDRDSVCNRTRNSQLSIFFANGLFSTSPSHLVIINRLDHASWNT